MGEIQFQYRQMYEPVEIERTWLLSKKFDTHATRDQINLRSNTEGFKFISTGFTDVGKKSVIPVRLDFKLEDITTPKQFLDQTLKQGVNVS